MPRTEVRTDVAVKLEKSLASRLKKAIELLEVDKVVSGGTVKVGIRIQGWNAGAVGQQPDPGRWTHVSCHLFCDQASPSFYWFAEPARSQKITHDGQQFYWTFKLDKHWAEGKRVLIVIQYSDDSGNGPEYDEVVTAPLDILAPG